MFVRNSTKFGKNLTIIYPGEYYASNSNELVGTLLGSCVALCLFDESGQIAGMNHFMLPGRILSKDLFSDDSAKYGITAIYKLVHLMLKKGARKGKIQAKIFGGGHVLDIPNMSTAIPDDNVRIARAMMELEDISIVTSDVGGNFSRKVITDVQTGTVYIKRTTRQDVIKQINVREDEYAKRSFSDAKD